MNWFIRLWLEADQEPIEFPENYHEDWDEPRELTELAIVDGLKDSTARRIAYVRALKPGPWKPLKPKK